MPILEDEKGFLYWEDAWGAPSLGLNSECLQTCIDEVLSRDLEGVFGHHPVFQEPDLKCLSQLSHISCLQLWDITLSDVSALYELKSLKFLRLSGKRPSIDLTRLKSVQNLVLEHHRRDIGLSELHDLKMINLWRYKASSPEAYELELPPGLEEMGLFWSNVESLDGLGRCPNVKKLEIARCRNLTSLGKLAETFPNLEHLVVDACGRLTAKEARRALSGHESIRHAFAGEQLIVSTKV